MKHSFHSSQLDTTKCASCNHEAIDHTDRATCESCGNSGNCEIFGEDILLCSTCEYREIAAMHGITVKPNGHTRVDSNPAIKAALDYSIVNWTDVFNARPVPIAEIIQSVNTDPTIENKHFTIAKLIDKMHKEYQSVITLANAKTKEWIHHDMQMQLFMNEFMKKLKAEEREQISIKDVNYRPATQPTAKPRNINIRKIDDKMVRAAAKESGLPENAIQMAVNRGASIVDAVRAIRLVIDKAITLDEAIKEVKRYHSEPIELPERKAPPKAYDGNEVARVSAESKIPSAMIQMMVTLHQITPTEAVERLKGQGYK